MSSPAYAAATARADKMLEPDGSITTHSGTVVSGPNPTLAQDYTNATARADKLLQPDGSIVTSGSGSGGATPPGGVSGQVQYNNAGVFAGAPILTDGTNVAVGESSVPAFPFTAGAGANIYLEVGNPSGTYSGPVIIRPTGSGGNAYVYSSAGTLQLSGSNGQYVTIGYPASSGGWLFGCNGSFVNFCNFAGAATGSSPSITASGNDTNISLNINAKGTGSVSVGPNLKIAGNNPTISTLAADMYVGSAHFESQFGVWCRSASAGSRVTGMDSPGPTTLQFYANSGVLMSLTTTAVVHALACVPVYANNAAAVAGGLGQGSLYRTGADPDQLCIVH